MTEKNYVLITPAHNEESFIEDTIKAVVSQTILPKKWIIVNDRSTDNTEKIISRYSDKYYFIHLLSVSGSGSRNFGAKVAAFNAGYKQLENIHYDFIGNLDADVSFNKDYFKRILEKFQRNPNIGIAGGTIKELINGKYCNRRTSLNSVAGAVQLFRRECYEDIGGYIELEYGGIDAAAEITARSQGWQVKRFPEIKILHHRRVLARQGNILKSKFQQGIMHFSLGYHPLFQIIRCCYRIANKPYFLGAVSMLCGYTWAYSHKYPMSIPDNVVQFLRSEQKRRLRKLLYLGRERY